MLSVAHKTPHYLPATQQPYYAPLTGVRAVAAYMVVFCHFNPRQYQWPLATPIDWRYQFISTWTTGVTVFFVLSGFLITVRYLPTLQLRGAWWRRYLQNRFARIYPVYFLLTALSFGLMQLYPSLADRMWRYGQWKDKLAIIVLNLTLLRAYFRDMSLVGLPTAWSLTVEETFYLAAPLLLLGVRRNRWALLIYPVLLIGAGLLLVHLLQGARYGLLVSVRYMFVFTFFGRCTDFVIGIGLGLLVRRAAGNPRPGGGRYTAAGAVAFLVCLLGMMAVNVHLNPEWPGDSVPSYGIMLTVFPVAVAVLLWGLVQEQTRLSRFLALPLLQLLGRSSYVLYLIHLGPLDTAFTQGVSGNVWVKVVSYTVVAIALHKLVEYPLHKWLKAK